MSLEHEKQLAAEAAAELIEDGMTVGLGTGSTVAYLLPALARRGLSLRCVATSPRTEGKLFADKAEADALLRSSGLDWTLVYPAILTNGSLTGTYTAREAPRRKVSSRVSRADVADFMLKQADSKEWSRRDAILDR
jgi:uncharacterized protein YbjT (DUF2867 family)